MRLEQLYYLIEIEKYASISMASRHIHVTQQNISNAIKQLEKELSLVLLKRTVKGVEFTEDGQVVLQKAREIWNTVSEINDYAFSKNVPVATAQKLSGKIDLWISPYYAKTFFLNALNQFMQIYPGVEIEIHTAASLEIVDLLMADEPKDILAFINITKDYYQEQLVDNQKLVSEVINTDYLVVLLNKRSKLAQYKSVSAKRILEHKLLFYKGENEKNDWMLDYFLQFQKPLNTVTTNSPEICLASLKKNTVIAVMANQAAKVFSANEEIIQVPIRPKIEIYNLLLRDTAHQLSQPEVKFIDTLNKMHW